MYKANRLKLMIYLKWINGSSNLINVRTLSSRINEPSVLIKLTVNTLYES